MDVKCLTCGEPWDVYHLWDEAIHDTGLSESEIEAWKELPRAEKLSERFRQEFKAAGYEFGMSLVDVRRCPCCPENQAADPEQAYVRSEIAEMLGDDEDGLAATLEELGVKAFTPTRRKNGTN